MSLLVALWACSGGVAVVEPAPAPPAAGDEAPVPTASPAPSPPTQPSSAEPSNDDFLLELQFVGVGGLHQRWFKDPDITRALDEALSACLTGRAVVRVTWDEETRIGTIELHADGGQLRCRPSAGGDVVDLQPLVPVGRALAAYRDSVASRFDFRVASFRVHLFLQSRKELCRLTLGGQFPPDGSTFDRCVDLAGQRRCAVGGEPDGLLSFRWEDPAHTRYLSGCLRP